MQLQPCEDIIMSEFYYSDDLTFDSLFIFYIQTKLKNIYYILRV